MPIYIYIIVCYPVRVAYHMHRYIRKGINVNILTMYSTVKVYSCTHYTMSCSFTSNNKNMHNAVHIHVHYVHVYVSL